MVINKMGAQKFDGDCCDWCGLPISREDVIDGFLVYKKSLHRDCADDYFENDGDNIPEPLSKRINDRATYFNTYTNRYEYADDHSPVACNISESPYNNEGEGLPWENKSNKTTPDGSSIKSGWGEVSTWGDPRPLG